MIQPMDEDEAVEQMELLGHDFFVFFNPQAKAVNVIYKRRDGNYGLLQPQVS
jgi:putative sigma-54 modulation protein